MLAQYTLLQHNRCIHVRKISQVTRRPRPSSAEDAGGNNIVREANKRNDIENKDDNIAPREEKAVEMGVGPYVGSLDVVRWGRGGDAEFKAGQKKDLEERSD
jgi:hypothetical protein